MGEGEAHGHHSHMASMYDALFEDALHWINFVGSWILLFGVGVALLNFGFLVVQHFTGYRFKKMFFALTQPDASRLSLDHIKLELSRIVAFSLLILVAADVLETLLKPMHDLTMEDLYKMALVGAIRTTLAFFLGKEMEEIMHHIAHADHDHHDDDDHHDAAAPSKEVATTVSKEEPSGGNGNQNRRKRNKQKKV